jgi:hypothetical protein
MTVYVVRDYHMDPEKAEETGEDPVDTLLSPDLEYDEFPYRVLDLLECNYFYGSDRPEDDELPPVGEKTVYGEVEFTDEGEIVEFTPAVETKTEDA